MRCEREVPTKPTIAQTTQAVTFKGPSMGFGEKALQVLSLRCLGALLVDWEEEKGGFFPKSAGARGGVEGKNITCPVKWHIHLSHEQGTGGG